MNSGKVFGVASVPSALGTDCAGVLVYVINAKIIVILSPIFLHSQSPELGVCLSGVLLVPGVGCCNRASAF